MRVLIVHNVLWAHYKSLLFERLAKQFSGNDQLLVVQLALTEGHRKGLGMPDPSTIGYPFQVLHNGALDNLPLSQRIRRLWQAAQAFRPNVVLLTGYYDPAQLLLGVWLRLRGCRVILQNESTALDNPRTGWRENLKRAFIRLCDGFFCFGTRAADYMVQLGARPNQILVRNNAVVDNAKLARTYAQSLLTRQQRQAELGLKPHNLIYVGRLIEAKNLSVLLDAFASATRQTDQPDKWGLILLGEGDQKTTLQNRASQLGITDLVAFLPGCDWQDVPTYLALADALVLPSLSEPWGLVVNEAMACGLPVLVSDRCGCAVDLVREGENGYTFAPDAPEQLIDRIVQLLNASPAERSRMGQASARLVQGFEPDRVGQAMYEALKRVAHS